MTCSLATFHASDVGVITSATEVPTLPVTNLLTRMPFDRYRSTGTTAAIIVDFGAAVPVSQVVLLYTNATAAATVRVRAATTQANTTLSPTFDTGTIDHQPGSRDWSTWGRTHFMLDLSAAHSQRWWRLDINQVSGATFYEAARLGLLDPYRPSRGIDWGDRIIPFDATRLRRSRNGTGHPVAGGVHREAEIRLTAVASAESEFLATYGDLQRRVNGRVPMLYCKRPKAVTIGASAVGGLTMYRNDNLMDELIYGYIRELAFPENDERHVRRLRFSIVEAVHP